ncbi:MAG: LptF/LptG family permease [Gemmatimonadales bacterium]
MRLLDRYIVRQLVAPFLFALSGLTGLLLLNQVADKIPKLVGKGLPWSVVGEFFLLTLPFILVMTVPMAVLLATLYAFTHLAADNEITAMRASGVSVHQMLRPVIVAGLVLSAANFLLTDQIHPRTNARLKALIEDIGRKKPTLDLREQAINPIPPSAYFLRASRIDAATGKMRDVSLFDLNDRNVRRVIYADSGRLAYETGHPDLELRLYDGVIHEYEEDHPELFQTTAYRVNTIKVRNVANSLDRQADTSISRGDREMTTCEMDSVVQAADRDATAVRADAARLRNGDLRIILRLPPLPPPLPTRTLAPRPCGWRHWIGLVLPKTAEAQVPAQQHPVRKLSPMGQQIRRRKLLQAAQMKHDSAWAIDSTRQAAATRDSLRSLHGGAAPVALAGSFRLSNTRSQLQSAVMKRNDFLVEIWKKWALSFACLIFALVGVPLALRFPRGGMGLVIGAGLGLFSLYYSALIGGEALGKRGLIPPFWSMWAPNVVLLVAALIGIQRVSRESGSTRGGDLKDLLDSIFGRFRRAR